MISNITETTVKKMKTIFTIKKTYNNNNTKEKYQIKNTNRKKIR